MDRLTPAQMQALRDPAALIDKARRQHPAAGGAFSCAGGGMSEGRIKWEVSAGSLINLAALAVAVAVAWGVMSERSANSRDNMDALSNTLRAEVAARRDAQTALEARVRALEHAQARADERFNSVLQVLGRIEARLERIEGRP